MLQNRPKGIAVGEPYPSSSRSKAAQANGPFYNEISKAVVRRGTPTPPVTGTVRGRSGPMVPKENPPTGSVRPRGGINKGRAPGPFTNNIGSSIKFRNRATDTGDFQREALLRRLKRTQGK